MGIQKIIVSCFYIVSIFFYSACSWNTQGSFSFHAIDESEFSDLEQKWYSPKIFRRREKPVIFYDNENLWYCYQTDNPSYDIDYTISLSRKHHEWFEVMVEHQKFNLGNNVIIGKLGRFDQGHYLLQIFIKSQGLGKIKFDIFPDEKQVAIDYDSLDIIQSEATEDDIIFYSK